MTTLLPSTRPRLTREDALARLNAQRVRDGAPLYGAAGPEVAVLGLRGYYQDRSSDNRRGIYDDALVIIGPDHYSTYNGNVDPSVFRKGIARLANGTWLYKRGIHGLSRPKAQRYKAWVQAGEVLVFRDNIAASGRGYFGINIHRGGQAGTSSLGCQTLPVAQWTAFDSTLLDQLQRHGQKVVRYTLTG